MSARLSSLMLALLLGACATAPASAPLENAAAGQKAWTAACGDNDEWDKPGPPFRLHGNSYYVGTCGITALLVTDPSGHVVIDSGTDEGAKVVLANIRKLGFDPADVDFILMSHEHFDHVGGMARLQQATGATVMAHPAAAAVLKSGVVSPDDPQSRSGHPPFPPVGAQAVVTIEQERPQNLGGLVFRPLFTPGHTAGATSWQWRACDGGDCKSIVYADSLNPISSDGYRFSGHPALVAGFRAGTAKVTAADCDIVMAPHPVAVSLRDRLAGDKALVDRSGCRAFAATADSRMDKRLAEEAAGG